MARYTLCFILLAAALGHAIQPASPADQSVPATNLVGPSSPIPASGQLPLATTESQNDLALGGDAEGTCYKIRAYIFKRDDDHAPLYLRSTTCGPGQPRAKNAAWPKARVVPAD